MTITRFEDIEVWQMGRKLCQDIFALAGQGGLNRDFSLKDQIFRSSGSIMDNIAEGFDAGSNREFIRFLNYSKRSSTEVRSQLYRILDRQYCDQSVFEALYSQTASIRSKIGAFINYLESLDPESPSVQARHTSIQRTAQKHDRPTDKPLNR